MSSEQNENTEEDGDSMDPFFAILREYEESIDAKNPLTLKQLVSRYPQYKERLVQHFRRLASLHPLQSEPTKIELCETDRYKHIRHYDKGGMGAVFLAHDCYFDRPAALKVPLVLADTDQKAIQRMEREALLSGHLQHPNILPIFEKGEVSTKDGRKMPFFAMRFLDGQNLLKMLDDRQEADKDYMQYVLIFQQVCRAMAYAHSQGIVNLDLKPSNVMIGGFNDAYVIDWGLAVQLPNRTCQAAKPANALTSELAQKSESRNSASSGMDFDTNYRSDTTDSDHFEATLPYHDIEEELSSIGCTDVYAPPEIKKDGIDLEQLDFKRIDVFCLGGILCKIVTGATPFQRSDLTNLQPARTKIRQSKVSAGLKRIALDCLSECPKDRPADAAEVDARITRFILDQEQATLRSERRLKNLILLVGVLLISLTIASAFFTIQSAKVATQQTFWQAGLRSLSAGNLAEAEKQFSNGIELGNAPLSFQVKRIRSRLANQSRDQSMQEAQSLLDAAHAKEDRAELLLILGDLKACDSKYRAEFRADLEAALKLGVLNEADSHYANALLTDQIEECRQHLEQALSAERSHNRAACLYAAVLLASGKMKEAEDLARLYLTIFPMDVPLQAVSESCLALANNNHKARAFTNSFDQKLASLRLGFLPPSAKDDADPTDQFAFARQGIVATNVSSFIRELPKVSVMPGLPRAVFDARSKYFGEIASLASKLGAPQNLWDVAREKLQDRKELIKQIDLLSRNESDAFPIQVLACAKFVTLAMNYKSWSKDSPELIQNANVEIDEIQSQCLGRQTIAPRGLFELASRIVGFLVHIQLARLDKSRRDVANEKLQEDLDRLRELLLQYPQMLTATCSLVLETYSAADSESPPTLGDIANQLQFASLWVAQQPQDAREWLARAKMCETAGHPEDAIKDLRKCLEINPKLEEARSRLESLESKKKD